MRNRLSLPLTTILFLVLFAVIVGWRGYAYFDTPRLDIWATPSAQPDQAAPLIPVKVRKGETVCVSNVPFGPQARYAWVTPLPGRKTRHPIDVVARAPGYVARAEIPRGAVNNQPAFVPLRPAAPSERLGTLCLTPHERRAVSFYGVPAIGRTRTESITTVDGREPPAALSLTILTSFDAPLATRLGTLTDRIAAFRPGGSWLIWSLGLLLVFGTPVAVAFALSLAAAEDDEDGNPPDPRRQPQDV